MKIDKSSYRSYYAVMKAIGIKALKNNLSRYLQLVRKGTLIYVTDRDEVIAEIRKPMRSVAGQISAWDAYLNQAEQSGLLQRATRHTSTLSFPSKKSAHPDSVDIQSILHDTRNDRLPL